MQQIHRIPSLRRVLSKYVKGAAHADGDSAKELAAACRSVIAVKTGSRQADTLAQQGPLEAQHEKRLMILQVSEEQRMLMLTVQKSMLWPEDESLLPKVDIDKLPPWRSEKLLKLNMTKIFIRAILSAKSKKNDEAWHPPEDLVEATMHGALEYIDILIDSAWSKARPPYPCQLSCTTLTV